jgi:hypothetical protein
VLSKEGNSGQQVIGTGDVKPPAGRPSAKQIKFMPIPYEWAADNAPAIRKNSSDGSVGFYRNRE